LNYPAVILAEFCELFRRSLSSRVSCQTVNILRKLVTMVGIYLDYNATTPVDAAVVESIIGALESGWANPSSEYSIGLKAKGIVDMARLSVARVIKSNPKDIIFTSGGTEVLLRTCSL